MTPQPPGETSVVIVDDHPVVRQGIRDMLESYDEVAVVAEADNPESALRVIREVQPHVVLLDIHMPKAVGVRLASTIRSINDRVKIIVLTAFDDDEFLYGALEAGVDGYLLKTTTSEELVRAIRAVVDGERVVGAGLSGRVIERVRDLLADQHRRESGLTDQDIEILRYIAGGLTTQEIATRIYLSEISVKRRVAEIMAKLEVHNRPHAVSEAMRRGLI